MMEKIPLDLKKTLALHPKAKALWDNLTPIGRRDFLSWIDSAKQAKTRARRVESIPSRLLSGKRRPCCYAVVPMNLYTALNASPKAKAAWKEFTPDARRDLIGWIEEAKDKAVHRERIAKACVMLALGKRHP